MHFEYLGLTESPPRLMPYQWAWDHQREVLAGVAEGTRPDTVLYVEHEPVYTAGRRTTPDLRPFDGTPVVDVDRGGLITWHGPGQLVGYPIVALPEGVGVVDHVRRVEEAVIRYLAALDLSVTRIPGRTGVWFTADDASSAGSVRPERKVCAIGIRVTRRTTMHGFALNVTNALAPFDNMVPCGIADASVTTLERELTALGRPTPTLVGAARAMEPLLSELLAFRPYTPTPDLPRGTDETAGHASRGVQVHFH